MARQLGMREVLGGEFKTLWWANDTIAAAERMERYLRAMDRAEQALESNLERYLHLWEYSTSDDLKSYDWDYSKFGRGERFVRQALSPEDFQRLLEQSNRWGLDNHVTERAYDKLVYAAAR